VRNSHGCSECICVIIMTRHNNYYANVKIIKLSIVQQRRRRMFSQFTRERTSHLWTEHPSQSHTSATTNLLVVFFFSKKKSDLRAFSFNSLYSIWISLLFAYVCYSTAIYSWEFVFQHNNWSAIKSRIVCSTVQHSSRSFV
jgi:hypothetical protein